MLVSYVLFFIVCLVISVQTTSESIDNTVQNCRAGPVIKILINVEVWQVRQCCRESERCSATQHLTDIQEPHIFNNFNGIWTLIKVFHLHFPQLSITQTQLTETNKPVELLPTLHTIYEFNTLYCDTE